MTALDHKLIDILIYPISKGSLKYDKENNEIRSEEAGLTYSIKDHIPVILPEKARKLQC